MPLSTRKLEKFLSTKGFIVEKYLMIDSVCIFLQTVSIQTAEIFLIYVPSKYNFKLENDVDSVELKIHKIPDRQPDVSMKYEEIIINDITKDINIKDKLLDKYKKPIVVEDSKNFDLTLKPVLDQLNRLKFCVTTLKYKLAILFNEYLCVITPINTVECFVAKGITKTKSKRVLYVIVNLEDIYQKSNITENITQIKEGVQSILEKNYDSHISDLEDFIHMRSDMFSRLDEIELKKNKYKDSLKNFEALFSRILDSEKELYSDLQELEDKSVNAKGLYNDIELSHRKSYINDKLENLGSIKRRCLSNIFKLREKIENLTLSADSILFDNTVLLEEIFNNLDFLTKL